MNRFPVADYNDQIDVNTITTPNSDTSATDDDNETNDTKNPSRNSNLSTSTGSGSTSTSGVGFGNFEGNVDDMYDFNGNSFSRRGRDIQLINEELSEIELVTNMFKNIDANDNDLDISTIENNNNDNFLISQDIDIDKLLSTEEKEMLNKRNHDKLIKQQQAKLQVYQGEDNEELGALISEYDDDNNDDEDDDKSSLASNNNNKRTTTNNKAKNDNESSQATIDFDKIFEGIRSTSSTSVTTTRASMIQNKYKQKYTNSDDDAIFTTKDDTNNSNTDNTNTLASDSSSATSSSTTNTDTLTGELDEDQENTTTNDTIPTTVKDLLDEDLQEFYKEMNE